MTTMLRLVVFALSLLSVESGKILAVLPSVSASISHQVVFQPLMEELAKRGHQVTVITTDPAYPNGGGPANLTEIDIHDISYKLWRANLNSFSSVDGVGLSGRVHAVTSTAIKVFDAQFWSDQVQNLIKDKTKQFDLLFIEAWFRQPLVFTHLYKVPTIQISSLGPYNGNCETIGAPVHPFLYPSIMRMNRHNLSLWDKLRELYDHITIDYIIRSYASLEDEEARKQLGPNAPSLDELQNNVDMLFLNHYPIWDGNRPVPPSVVYMGALHLYQKPEKELPEDLQSYMDSSKHGVIYISYGTNVQPSVLPREKIQMLINVVSKLPYDVLWKWDKDHLPGKTKNIRITKWVPQYDLLRHPKIKLFITQGGLQSTDEAIKGGVPLIGMPMSADQWLNVDNYVYHKIGLRVDIDTLTEEKLENAINTITGDESFRHNIARLRSLMLDQPQSPMERAVWWAEHLMRHSSGRHLRGPAANISWKDYLELELVAVILAIFFTITGLLTFSLYYLWRLLRNYVRTPKIKQN